MIQGAIFDLDGTLLDSLPAWDRLGVNYLLSRGCQPRADLREAMKPLDLYQCALYFQREYGVSGPVQEIMDGINNMIAKDYEEHLPLKPGVSDFLQWMAEQNVKMCIATATDRPLVDAALKRCGIRHYFSEIFTCTEVGHNKDEPVIYRAALAHLGTTREHTIIFEDAIHAVKTAKEDGFTVAAVYDPHETQQEVLRALADFYITDFTQACLCSRAL